MQKFSVHLLMNTHLTSSSAVGQWEFEFIIFLENFRKGILFVESIVNIRNECCFY